MSPNSQTNQSLNGINFSLLDMIQHEYTLTLEYQYPPKTIGDLTVASYGISFDKRHFTDQVSNINNFVPQCPKHCKIT